MSFATDRSSGSSDVARFFLDALENWVAVDRSPSAPAFFSALVPWLRAAQAAQPTLALIHQLAARALDIADAAVAREDSPADFRASLAASCAAERRDLEAQRQGVARTAASLVTEGESWIATLSSSSAVRDAMLEVSRLGRAPRAMVGESRPRYEGRELATQLAGAGIPVWLVVDAALPLLVSGARMVWMGADAVTDRGVINKVGSLALALAAREHSVPVYALATRRKFLPATTGALRILEMAPEEVWRDPPSGVRPRNVYFELVPLELLRGIVVEDVVLGAAETRTVATERPLPEALASAPAAG
jgi:translation initiation factor 2B subunit (eIF-2B alpha/beta/delta family)